MDVDKVTHQREVNKVPSKGVPESFPVLPSQGGNSAMLPASFVGHGPAIPATLGQ